MLFFVVLLSHHSLGLKNSSLLGISGAVYLRVRGLVRAPSWHIAPPDIPVAVATRENATARVTGRNAGSLGGGDAPMIHAVVARNAAQ